MKNLKKMLAALLLLLSAMPVGAQFLRSSYFMENAPTRLQLNPAYLPAQGYATFPVLSVNAATYSNSLGTQDFIDAIDSWNQDQWFNNSPIYNKLKDMNEADASVRMDVLSFGFYKGKGFWSFDVGIRVDGAIDAPKDLFDYLIDMNEMDWRNVLLKDQEWGFSNQRTSLNVYTEVGVGYARPINKKLTVGARAKLLLGMGNLDMRINNFKVNTYANGAASINVDAYAEANMRGLEMETSNRYVGDEYISDIDDVALNGFGVGGYGAGIDLGVVYQPIDKLTLSASILDLGFISWSKSSSTVARAQQNVVYDSSDPASYEEFIGRLDEPSLIDFDMIGLQEQSEQKARTTSTPATLAIGAEYAFTSHFSAGVLSTTRWGELHTLSELTISANYRPNRTIGLSGSYSMIKSAGKTFGFGLKLGPLMLGTDYLYLGKNTKSVNAYIGLAFNLGKTRKEALGENK